MTTTAHPDITPPLGADLVGQWEGEPSYRCVFGVDRNITDHEARVYIGAVQLADGSIEQSGRDEPSVYVCDGERDGLRLNSDQARELAALLLESATAIDAWAGNGCTTCQHWDCCPRHPKRVAR